MEAEKEKTITPFSNGTEAMMWYDWNCDQCKRAYKPKNGEPPDFKTTQKLCNLGMECNLKFKLDMAWITSEVPEKIALTIGWSEEKGMPESCRFFSDNDNDGFKPAPRKPPEPPKNQLCFPYEINNILEQKEKLEHA